MGFEQNGVDQRTGRKNVARLSRLARERADAQARHIPWQRLLDTRNQYLDWQEFYLWARAIMEVEKSIPDWLAEILRQRCPGFLDVVAPMGSKVAQARHDYLRLEDWIDQHIFGCARDEGWFNALQFYAVRDPRYQRAEVCWSECVKKWSQAKPIRYPTFEEWLALASTCDETAHLVPEQQRAQGSVKMVERHRLEEAVAQYIDWEAVAYWATPALESEEPLPDEVRNELEQRCPNFLSRAMETPTVTKRTSTTWEELMAWVAHQFFADARAEGWFDAILIGVRRHPRAIRTMEYADHCDESRGSSVPVPYPTFEEWRKEADSYVEAPD
jgi:hypothetical protein